MFVLSTRKVVVLWVKRGANASAVRYFLPPFADDDIRVLWHGMWESREEKAGTRLSLALSLLELAASADMSTCV